MQRADTLLHQRGLAPSRTLAQRLIQAGSAQYRDQGAWTVITKAGQKLPGEVELRLTDQSQLRYASRGGQKLDGALHHSGLDPAGMTVLDLGQSTGGFSDCLLQHQASKVVGIDSGRDQLAPKLQNDPRVLCLEGINARELPIPRLLAEAPATGFDAAVMDLSFISQTLVVPGLPPLLRESGYVLALVKPQFEVGPEAVGKGGIVRDASLYTEVEAKISQCYRANGFTVLDWFDSPITGGDGNREFFVFVQKPSP